MMLGFLLIPHTLVETQGAEYQMSRKIDPTDIIGETYGHVVVRALLRREPYKGRFQYLYEGHCLHCGEVSEFIRNNLLTGHTQSCGCLRRRAGGDHPCWGGHGEISAAFWKHILKHAEARRLPVDVTIEDAWALFLEQERKCALSGVPLVCGPRQRDRTASLDRIDNSKGYVGGNLQWLHKDINWMKGRFSQDDFVRWCHTVALHQRGETHVV